MRDGNVTMISPALRGWLSQLLGMPESVIEGMAGQLSNVILSTYHGPITLERYDSLSLSDLRAPILERGLRLFKYYPDEVNPQTGINYSRKSLESGTVHLSFPENYNDPFDCAPAFDAQKVLRNTLKRLSDYFELQVEDNGELCDYGTAVADAMNQLGEKGTPKLATLSAGTGVLDAQVLYLWILLTARNHGQIRCDDLISVINNKIENTIGLMRGCRVACFTTNCQNLYMWAHYANSHKGYCVEYETSTEKLLSLGYTNERLGSIFGNIFSVFYHPRRPDCTEIMTQLLSYSLDNELLAKLYARALCSKGFNWVFEEECRLIIQNQSDPSELPFLPPKRLYLGARARDDGGNVSELLGICRDKDIEVVRMIPQQSTYELREMLPHESE